MLSRALFDTSGSIGALLTKTSDTREPVLVWSVRGSRVVLSESQGQLSGNADVAQLVAHNLAKVRVASSSLVIRSSGMDLLRIPSRGLSHMVTWPSG